jgi:hypothetical protein
VRRYADLSEAKFGTAIHFAQVEHVRSPRIGATRCTRTTRLVQPPPERSLQRFSRSLARLSGTPGLIAAEVWRCHRTHRSRGPRVRIRLPPAESQSLGRIRVRGSRTPAFRAGVRGWFGDAVGRDAQGFPIRANQRQYLCRAIFQYRSAADVVGEDATPIPTKSGIPRFNVRQIFEFGSGSGKAEHGALIVPSERQT